MPNIEKLNHLNTESKFSRKPRLLDREQLEFFEDQSGKTNRKFLTHGIIVFAVILGLGSVTYMTIQQLKK
jgi:hypothetical protein